MEIVSQLALPILPLNWFLYFRCVFDLIAHPESVVVPPPKVRCKQSVIAVDQLQIVCELLHGPVVPDIDVGVGRGEGGHVRSIVHDRDHVVATVEDVEKLLCHIILTQPILKGEVEFILVVHATFVCTVVETSQVSTFTIHIHRNVLREGLKQLLPELKYVFK